jgi:hypothetical protein
MGGTGRTSLRKARRARFWFDWFDIGRETHRDLPPTASLVFPPHTHTSRYLRDAASSGNRTCETAGETEE